jgi:hypothetical protein
MSAEIRSDLRKETLKEKPIGCSMLLSTALPSWLVLLQYNYELTRFFGTDSTDTFLFDAVRAFIYNSLI